MKEHRSIKSKKSRLTCWIWGILPFDFHIDSGANMGLVYYISRQPNQKAAVTNKNDIEFLAAIISRI